MISMSHGVNDIISTDGCLSLNVDIYSINTLLTWLKSVLSQDLCLLYRNLPYSGYSMDVHCLFL